MLLLLLSFFTSHRLLLGRCTTFTIDMNRLHIEELDHHLLHQLCTFRVLNRPSHNCIELLIQWVCLGEVRREQLSVCQRLSQARGKEHGGQAHL